LGRVPGDPAHPGQGSTGSLSPPSLAAFRRFKFDSIERVDLSIRGSSSRVVGVV